MYSRRRRWVEVAAILLVAHIGCRGSDATALPVPAAAVAVTPRALIGTVGTNVAQAPSVKVTTSSGAPVPDVSVTFSVVTGGGSIVGANHSTNASGVATVSSWTLGTVAGLNTLSATVLSLPPVTFSATAAPGPAAKLSIATPPSSAQNRAVFGVQPIVQLQDQYANTVTETGRQVTASVAAGPATLSGTVAVGTDATGKATYTNLKLSGTVGNRTLTFGGQGLTSASASVSLTAGAAATIAIVAGDAQTAVVGAVVPVKPAVKVTDADANPVAGVTVIFAVDSGGGSVTGPSQITDSAGIAALGGWTLGTKAGLNRITATSPSLAGNQLTLAATAIPGAESQLAIVTAPSPMAPNRTAFAVQPVVQLLDAAGNAVAKAGATITASIASGGGTIGGTATTTTNASGVATFTNLSIAGVVGARTLSISGNGLTAASAPVLLRAGAATTLALVAGNNQSAPAGSAVATTPSVIAKDADANVVTGVSITFTVTSGDGTLTAASPSTDTLGLARVGTWTLGPIPGANSVTASAAGLSGSPVTFNATADPAFQADTTLVDSTAASVGSQIILPTGTVAHVVSSSAAPSAVLKLTEVSGDNPTAGNDSSRHFVVEFGGGVNDSVVVSLSVATGDAATGTNQWLFVQDSGALGHWVSPVSSGAGVPPSLGSPASAEGVASGAFLHSVFVFTVKKPLARAFLVQLSPADPPDCENIREFKAHPRSPQLQNPAFTVVLIHGWQPTMICKGANVPGLSYYDDFHPEIGWDSMALAISERFPAANIQFVRYSSSAPPSDAGLYIRQQLTDRNTGPVILVGHSMGGLVARYAANGDLLATKIIRIITLGTPHLGTPVADLGVDNKVFRPSPGFDALTTGSVNSDVPLPAPVPTYAARGHVACSDPVGALLFPTFAILCLNAIASDGVVPHTSAVPALVTDSSTSTGVNHSQLFSHAPTIQDALAWIALPRPTIELSSPSASLTAVTGAQEQAATTVTITGTGSEPLSGLTVGEIVYQSSPPAAWLTAFLSGSAAPFTLSLSASAKFLPVGSYTANVPIRASTLVPSNSPQVVAVTFVVTADLGGPSISLSVSSRDFVATVGGASPAAQTVQVTNGGGGAISGLSAAVSYQASQPTGWLSASLSAATAPATLTLGPTVGSLGAGVYNATVNIASSAGGVSNSPQALAVTLTVLPPAALQRLAVGSFHTCMLDDAGSVTCWGDNQHGQLGDGTTTDRHVPTASAAGHTFTAIAAGGAHTCALTSLGAAMCWGYNSGGALGDATSTTHRTAPGSVVGGHAFVRLSAGNSHTCGLTNAGAVYCWGDNTYGQIGDGTGATGAYAPQNSPVLVSGSAHFISVSAGSTHTCGTTSNGVAYCWGENNKGQLGDGTTVNRAAPVPVSGTSAFASVSAGQWDTCAITLAGAAYCWGDNSFGELGDGTSQDRPVPGPVIGGVEFASIASGFFHRCGLSPGGAAYCWGYNGYGRIGVSGASGSYSTPTAVAGGIAYSGIGAGTTHSCGATVSGNVYCWGDNTGGEVGDGTTATRIVPTIVVPTSVPSLAVSATARSFAATVNALSPAAQTIQISNGGGGTLSGLDATVAYQGSQPTGWLSATLNSTTAPATLTITTAVGSLAEGTYDATVTVAASGATSASADIAVTLIVAAPFQVTIGGPIGDLIVVGSTIVYFDAVPGSSGQTISIRSRSVNGGTLNTLAVNRPFPIRLLSDGAHVYWTEYRGGNGTSAVLRVPLAGGAIDTLASGLSLDLSSANASVELDDQYFYFKTLGPSSTTLIQRVAKSGGTPTPIVTTTLWAAFTIADGWLYYEDGSTIKRMPTAGGASTELASGVTLSPSATAFKVAGSNLVILSNITLSSVPITGGAVATRGTVGSIPQAASPYPVRPVSDGESVWFQIIGGTERIVRFRLSDFAKTVVWTGTGCFGGLAVDDTYIYLADKYPGLPHCIDGVTAIIKVPK